jgi:hypothetical protein
MSTLIQGDIVSTKTYLFQEVCLPLVTRKGKEYRLEMTPRTAQTLLVTPEDQEVPTTRVDLVNWVGLTGEGAMEVQEALGGREALEDRECQTYPSPLVVSYPMARKFLP